MNQPFERALGSDTFKVPFFKLFVRSRPRFKDFSSALGPIFKFLSMLGHNFLFGGGGGGGVTRTFLKNWQQSIFQAEKLTENSCQYGRIL